MILTATNVPPNISEDQRKINMENFINTECRISKMKKFSHCFYDSKTNNIHIYTKK